MPVGPDGARGDLAFSESLAGTLNDSGLEVILTGAGGWVGRAVLEMLGAALEESFPSKVHAFGSRRRSLSLRSGRVFMVEPLESLTEIEVGPHLLVHLAFLTREHAASQDLESYVATNEAISSVVINHARRTEVHGLFLPSSGAVYGPDGEPDHDLQRNPYGVLKRRDESRFEEVCDGERTAMVRLFNLAGPFLNKPERYALGSIILQLSAGGPVTLRADHPVIRSYVHVADLVELAFSVMLGLVAGPGEPFDTAGECEIEIGDLARLAASVVGLSEAAIERPRVDGTRPDRYVGNGTVLRGLAAQCDLRLIELPDQIADTARYLEETGAGFLPDLPGG